MVEVVHEDTLFLNYYEFSQSGRVYELFMSFSEKGIVVDFAEGQTKHLLTVYIEDCEELPTGTSLYDITVPDELESYDYHIQVCKNEVNLRFYKFDWQTRDILAKEVLENKCSSS